jgi:hypothetical protein
MRYHPFFLAWKKERNRAFFVFSASRKIQAWRWGPSSATTSLFLGSGMSQPPPPPPRQPLPSSPQTDYFFVFLPTTDWDGHLREALLYFVFKKNKTKASRHTPGLARAVRCSRTDASVPTVLRALGFLVE